MNTIVVCVSLARPEQGHFEPHINIIRLFMLNLLSNVPVEGCGDEHVAKGRDKVISCL